MVYKLISDNESAFVSKVVLDFLKKNDVDIQIEDEQNHHVLGIIDRFIRTIRDKHGSNKPISQQEMSKIIAEYNNTVHSTIKMKPNNMGEKEEVEYIMECYRRQHKIENQSDYKLEEGDYVRLIKMKNSMKKRRRTLTKHYYVVSGFDLKKVIIMAKDGATQTVSRSDLVKISKNTSLTQANSIRDAARGELVRIIKYYPKSEKYDVEFKGEDGKPWFDKIPVKSLRSRFPNRISELEFEFFKKNKHN